MRRGCYRFQAQYLRQIRVPDITAISPLAASELRRAFADRDRQRATSIAARLYGVDETVLGFAAPQPVVERRPYRCACRHRLFV